MVYGYEVLDRVLKYDKSMCGCKVLSCRKFKNEKKSNKFLDITSRIYLASHVGVGCITQTLNKTLELLYALENLFFFLLIEVLHLFLLELAPF